MEYYRPQNRINTTLAKQLAIYVVLYSPWQMAADIPSNYENHPAFQFIKDVPTNWDQSIPLKSKIGEYTAIVRRERESENWYLGAITNKDGRKLKIKLDFLNKDSRYKLIHYGDSYNASWSSHPYGMDIQEKEVQSGESLEIFLAPGGGAALQFIEIN
jgi:alpha-glucosidase